MTAPTLIGGCDIETTGLSQEDGHRIIEIAVVIRTPQGAPVGRWSTPVNPERGIDEDATKIHGKRLEDLLAAPTWSVVAPKLSALLAKLPYCVMHNGIGFDAPFIYRELLRAGQPLPRMAITDTMVQGRWATPDGALPNLKALCFACDVPYDPEAAHGADYDVDVMLDCFFKQLPRGFFTLATAPYELPPLEKK